MAHIHKAVTLMLVVLCASMLSPKDAFAEGADLFAPSQAVGRGIDAARALPITPFYSEPPPEQSTAPGTLVRAEPAADYALPAGVTATRILYHSRTASGEDALASGVVLVPY